MPVEQHARQLRHRRKMQIGENDLALAQARVLRLDGLLHFHDHLGTRIDFVRRIQDLGARRRVLLIGKA
jgi:hypothetical protein